MMLLVGNNTQAAVPGSQKIAPIIFGSRKPQAL